MKKIVLALVLVVLCTGTALAAGSATGGSTKPETTSAPAAPEAQASETFTISIMSDAEKKEAAEAARKARIEKQQQEATQPAAPKTSPAMPDTGIKAVTQAPKAVATNLCNDIEDMKKRIECRLTKTKEEIDAELAQVYMPEECRAIKDNDTWKNTCVERYQSLRPCWSEPIGAKRISCVKETLGLPEKLQNIDDYCLGKADGCRADYSKKIYYLVTFRFYDAEERVEEWYEDQKISLSDAVDFIHFIARSKIQFYQEARSKTDRLTIINAVSQKWDQMVAKVKK